MWSPTVPFDDAVTVVTSCCSTVKVWALDRSCSSGSIILLTSSVASSWHLLRARSVVKSPFARLNRSIDRCIRFRFRFRLRSMLSCARSVIYRFPTRSRSKVHEAANCICENSPENCATTSEVQPIRQSRADLPPVGQVNYIVRHAKSMQ